MSQPYRNKRDKISSSYERFLDKRLTTAEQQLLLSHR